MLDWSLEFLGILSLGVLPILIAACLVGSIIAALRAVTPIKSAVPEKESKPVANFVSKGIAG